MTKETQPVNNIYVDLGFDPIEAEALKKQTDSIISQSF